MIAGMFLLIPAYVLLTGDIGAKQMHLKSIESNGSSVSEKTLTTRLQALSSSTQALATLAASPSASGLIRSFLNVSRPGVTITSWVYTPPVAKGIGTLSINGQAATRDALRKYQLALQQASFVKSADLPVSAFAQDSNISFTISIALLL